RPREDTMREASAGAADRRRERQGPQRVRHRGRDEDDRGHRAIDGPRGNRVVPKKRGKKYIEAAEKVEAALSCNGDGGLDPERACQMVRETSISKFDATVEAHIRVDEIGRAHV